MGALIAAPVIVLIGPPGSGKSAQAALLAQQLHGVHLSSGEILRATASPAVQVEMRQGELPTQPEVDERLAAALAAAPSDQAWVLDGFVRLQYDLSWLEGTLRSLERRLDRVIFLDIPADVSYERLAGRGREDDARAVIDERWRQYRTETLPLIETLTQQGIGRQVDGRGTPAQVAARVAEAV